jgi:hypothetical protein
MQIVEAIKLMRQGRALMRMFTPAGELWFVLGAGRVSDEVARAIVAHNDVEPSNDGLFKTYSQTFRLCRRDRHKPRGE